MDGRTLWFHSCQVIQGGSSSLGAPAGSAMAGLGQSSCATQGTVAPQPLRHCAAAALSNQRENPLHSPLNPSAVLCETKA